MGSSVTARASPGAERTQLARLTNSRNVIRQGTVSVA